MKSTIANDGKRSAFESNLGDVADALAAPQHTAKQQNFLDIKAHFWKKCQELARKNYIAFGLPMDELKKLEQEFNLNSEDCKSPLKKKLKSNTAATIDLTTSASPSSNHHYHGLSESEIDRIKGLKKFDLIAELDAVGGEYKKHWTKPVLIDAYLDTLADQKFPPAQTKQQIDDAVDSHLLVGNNVMAMEIDSNIVLEKEESMKIEPLPVPVRRHSEIVNLTRNSLDNKIYSTTTPPKQGAVRRAIAATEEKVAASEMARETAAMTKTSMTPGKVGRLGMPLLYSSATVEDHAELAMIFNHSGSKMIHNPALDFQSTNTGSSRVVDMGSTTINETVDLESTILSKPSYFVQNKEATTTSLKAPTSHGSDSKVDRPFPISESSSNTKTAQSSHRPPVYATPTVNSNDAKSVTSDNAKKARVAELKAMSKQGQNAGATSTINPIDLVRDTSDQCRLAETRAKHNHRKYESNFMPPISRPLATPAAPPTVLTKDSAIASTANKCNSIRDPKDKFKNKDRVAEARAQQLQKNEQRKHQPIMRPLATPSQPGTVLSKSLAGLFTSKSSASDSRQNQHMHKKENGLPVVDIRTTEQFQNSSHHPGHSTPMLSIAVLKPIERTAQQQGKATAMAASFELNKQLLHSDKKVVKEKGVDNYEMTDNEDNSDSDDGSACSRASEAKRVPDWAKSKNLVPALERQYSKDYKVDPDELFGEVTSCDLAAIFNKKSKKYNRRNSSGEWSAHRVTSAEKQAYKLAVM